MRKSTRIVRKLLALFLVVLMSIESFGALVSDNDGSAFITKAEFDSLRSNFQTQINNFNTSIDNKIDGAIAAYLAGIAIATEKSLSHATSRITYPLKVYFNQDVSQLRNFTSDYTTNSTNYYRPDWDVEMIGSLNCYLGRAKYYKDNYTPNNKFRDFIDGRILSFVNGTRKYLMTGYKRGVKLINSITAYVLQIGGGGYNDQTGWPQSKAVGHLFMDASGSGDVSAQYRDIGFADSSSWVASLPSASIPWTNNFAPFQWWNGTAGTTLGAVTLTTGTYINQRLYKHANAVFIGGRKSPGVTMWASSLYTDEESQIDKLYMQAPATSRFPVLYEAKIKMTNNKHKVQNLMSNILQPDIWADGSMNNASKDYSGKLLLQHVVEPGLSIEAEGFSEVGARAWYDMSLIDASHICYEVVTPSTGDTYYQNMLDGILCTELTGPMEVGCLKINCTNSGTTNKKYVVMSKNPILFEGDPVGVDLSSSGFFNLAGAKDAATWSKYIELSNGNNSIYFKYDGSQKNDKIYYKIVTTLGSTEYTTINRQPEISFWTES